MKSYQKTIITGTLLMCVSFLIATVIDAGFGFLRVRSQYAMDIARLPTSPTRVFTTYVTVTSIDQESNILVARIRSIATGTDLDVRLKIPPSFIVNRQDPIIQDGIMTGVMPIAPADRTEITFGTHGLGMISTSDEGEMYITYLLIGEPFPRP